ncbi:MAG: hypothetical protein QOE68_3947 [Thermoanaerobaculia bacterium]|nr:hypothetical protein [Thermoanaerobaculia bacterium]
MEAKELIRLPDQRKKVRAELREVVKEIHGKPHLLIRLHLTGWHFPHRGAEPFVAVGDVVSKRVTISRDELTADAYFDKPLPAAERLSFGYGKIISWDFDIPIDPHHIAPLDRTKLPHGIINPF